MLSQPFIGAGLRGIHAQFYRKMHNSILLRMRNSSGVSPDQTDRKCFVSTAIIMAAHKTLVRAAPRHPANASRLHSKLRTRSPLFCGFCAGNLRPERFRQRNSGLYRFMHNHADAQKSSGVFFGVPDGEMCRK